jgi:hypothetical protein
MRKRPVAKTRQRTILSSTAIFLLGTVIGVVITLYVGQWFVALLPGPRVAASIKAIRGDTENTAGCLYYVIIVTIEQAVDYIYLKAQFPDKINNYKVGLPQESQTADVGRVAAQGWEAGKDLNGNCTIVQAAINNSADVQTSIASNMISIHASKLPPQTNIMGMVATTEGKSTISPRPGSVYTEAEYEYLKLGLTVRRRLRVSVEGIANAN